MKSSSFLLLGCLVGLVLVPAAAFSQAPTRLYDQVAPSVVYLRHELKFDASRTKYPELWKRFEATTKTTVLGAYLPVTTGSGFVVDDRGRVVTNRHVVEVGGVGELRRSLVTALSRAVVALGDRFTASERIGLQWDAGQVLGDADYRFTASSGSRVVGNVRVLAVAAPKDADLALVEITGDTASSSLELAGEGSLAGSGVGDEVAAFGYPLGDLMDTMFKERVASMTRGSISAIRGTELLDLQHSAAISPGNSGGPLVDSLGRVVGINTAAVDAKIGNSLFFAIGMGHVRAFLDQSGYGQVLTWNRRLAQMRNSPDQQIPARLTSVPEGARVEADGRYLGLTPLEVSLPAGKYNLSLTSADAVFLPVSLDLVPGTPVDRKITGKAGLPVFLSLPAPEHAAEFEFRTPEGAYLLRSTGGSLPPGTYSLVVRQVPGLQGVEIPVTVGDDSQTFDLAPFYLKSTLKLVGWEPGARVYLDGKNVAADSELLRDVPMGRHTVALWKDGRQPLLPVTITVREPGFAFVRWKSATGWETQANTLLWSGLGAAVAGATAGGLGWFLGQDSEALARTSDYQSYRGWKDTMNLLMMSGTAAVLTAVGLEIGALIADQNYSNQKKVFPHD